MYLRLHSQLRCAWCNRMPEGVSKEPMPVDTLHIVVLAYTEYLWDPRVRNESELLAHRGFRVEVIALRPKSGPSPDVVDGVRLREIPLVAQRGGKIRYFYQYALFFLLSTLQLVQLDLRERVDAVHIHSLPDFQVFAALPLWLRGVPVILDLHELLPEILATRFRLADSSVWVRTAVFLESISILFADRVIAANGAIKKVIVGRGAPAGKVTVIFNGGEAGGGGKARIRCERVLDCQRARSWSILVGSTPSGTSTP